MDEAEQRALEAREAKRSTRFKIALIVLAMVVAMDVAVIAAVLRGMAPPSPLAIIVLGVVTVGLAALAMFHGPGNEARRLNRMPGRRDSVQSARTSQMLIVTLTSAVLTLVAMLHSRDIVAGELAPSTTMIVAAFATMALTLPAMVMGWDGQARAQKRFLEDELTRVFRGRAITTGFWVLLPGVVLVYLFGLWRPDQAVVLMPLVLWAGGAAASLRFALLHRAAERDE